MTPAEVIELTKRISRMYNFVTNDQTYMDIWKHVARDADYDLTVQRFYEYLNNPMNTRRPPMPADIVVKPKRKDDFEIEREQMREWEAAAQANPPDWSRAKALFKRLGVEDDG